MSKFSSTPLGSIYIAFSPEYRASIPSTVWSALSIYLSDPNSNGFYRFTPFTGPGTIMGSNNSIYGFLVLAGVPFPSVERKGLDFYITL